jgi:two-component system OmpR family sensor kinase
MKQRGAVCPVFGDPKLLFQMFSNLISNAVKDSDDGRRIDITADTESQQVVVTIQDHGIGIPQRDLAHVFGRYNRGSNVSGIVGTGLVSIWSRWSLTCMAAVPTANQARAYW